MWFNGRYRRHNGYQNLLFIFGCGTMPDSQQTRTYFTRYIPDLRQMIIPTLSSALYRWLLISIYTAYTSSVIAADIAAPENSIDTLSTMAGQQAVPAKGTSTNLDHAVVKVFSTIRAPDPTRPWTKQAPTEAASKERERVIVTILRITVESSLPLMRRARIAPKWRRPQAANHRVI